MSNLRKAISQAIQKTGGAALNTREFGGMFVTYYKLPEGLSQWTPKGDENGIVHFIDYIPFIIGENFPVNMYKERLVIGQSAVPYMLASIHRNIGPQNASVLCNYKCYGERCPICEDLIALQRATDDKEESTRIWNELRTYDRQLSYNWVQDNEEEREKGVQFFEVAAFFMHNKIDAINKDTRTGEVLMFHSLDDGLVLMFTTKKKGSGRDSNWEYLGHQFKPRIHPKTKKPYVIEDEILDQVEDLPIDSFLKRMEYDEVRALYLEGKQSKEQAEEPVVKTTRTLSKPKIGKPADPEPAKEEEPPFDAGEDGNECPAGGAFGADLYKLPECDNCPLDTMGACREKAKASKPTKRFGRKQ